MIIYSEHKWLNVFQAFYGNYVQKLDYKQAGKVVSKIECFCSNSCYIHHSCIENKSKSIYNTTLLRYRYCWILKSCFCVVAHIEINTSTITSKDYGSIAVQLYHNLDCLLYCKWSHCIYRNDGGYWLLCCQWWDQICLRIQLYSCHNIVCALLNCQYRICANYVHILSKIKNW